VNCNGIETDNGPVKYIKMFGMGGNPLGRYRFFV
jgi:hypothetical protein